jgi:dihydrofolate synthase / folylpolyglutamate synthase
VIVSEQLTHFEALTLIAAQLFNCGDSPVDWAIWEVGLGGLYDATNAIPHGPCAITRLGLDHQAILGKSLEEIAAQKFGVIGKNAVVVHSPMPSELTRLREATTDATSCRWVSARPVDLLGLNRITTHWGSAEMALCGPRAAENTATALTLFETMGFSPRDHLGALAQVRWPGRFSRAPLPGWACPIYLSGDHNTQGVESLLSILSELSWQKLHLVVGIGEDKEAADMLTALCALPRVELHLTETSFKPLPLSRYPGPCAEKAAFSHPDVAQVLTHVRGKAVAGDLAVVTGSLYLIGKVLSLST